MLGFSLSFLNRGVGESRSVLGTGARHAVHYAFRSRSATGQKHILPLLLGSQAQLVFKGKMRTSRTASCRCGSWSLGRASKITSSGFHKDAGVTFNFEGREAEDLLFGEVEELLDEQLEGLLGLLGSILRYQKMIRALRDLQGPKTFTT